MPDAISGLSGISSISGISGISGLQGTSTVNPGSAADFGSILASAVDNVSTTQKSADQLALQAVTGGDLSDLHQATIAATRAQTTIELVATLRNKGVDAFNEIMRMQA